MITEEQKDKLNVVVSDRNETLAREYGKNLEKKVMLEIEIALQKELDPKEMSAKKPLSYNSQGQPQSYKQIERGEYIGILEENLEKINTLLKVIIDLFDYKKNG